MIKALHCVSFCLLSHFPPQLWSFSSVLYLQKKVLETLCQIPDTLWGTQFSIIAPLMLKQTRNMALNLLCRAFHHLATHKFSSILTAVWSPTDPTDLYC